MMKSSDVVCRYLLLLFILSLVLGLSGCVKEDRSACPCRLVLDFTEVDTAVVSSVDMTILSSSGFAFTEVVNNDSFKDYSVTVPRAELQLFLRSGTDYCLNADKSVTIPFGEDCPRIFVHKSVIGATGEQCRDKVMLKKDHCVITIQFSEGYDEEFQMTVTGKVNGYGKDCMPSVGEFSCKAVPDDSGACVVTVPRQLDSSLALEIDDGTEALKVFPIGQYIAESGYDWKAEDLDDITMTLDYSLMDVSLEICDWDNDQRYDIVI